jgi:hypothetical protein
MQRALRDPSDTDRRVYRTWTIAFSLAYGVIFAVFAGLAIHHSPISADDVAKVEGSKTPTAIQLAAKSSFHGR